MSALTQVTINTPTENTSTTTSSSSTSSSSTSDETGMARALAGLTLNAPATELGARDAVPSSTSHIKTSDLNITLNLQTYVELKEAYEILRLNKLIEGGTDKATIEKVILDIYTPAYDGNKLALKVRGRMIADGFVSPLPSGQPDYELAKRFYDLAIAAGEGVSARNVAILYTNNQVGTNLSNKDRMNMAAQYYEKGADLGDSACVSNMALHIIQGDFYANEDGTPNEALAQKWVERAARLEFDGEMMCNFARYIVEGSLHRLPSGLPNIPLAVEWYKKASDKGCGAASFTLGAFASENHLKVSPQFRDKDQFALFLFQLDARQGYKQAQSEVNKLISAANRDREDIFNTVISELGHDPDDIPELTFGENDTTDDILSKVFGALVK